MVGGVVSRNARSTWWFWVLLVVLGVAGIQAMIAVSTHDDACGFKDAKKHWVVLPPHWECERGF